MHGHFQHKQETVTLAPTLVESQEDDRRPSEADDDNGVDASLLGPMFDSQLASMQLAWMNFAPPTPISSQEIDIAHRSLHHFIDFAKSILQDPKNPPPQTEQVPVLLQALEDMDQRFPLEGKSFLTNTQTHATCYILSQVEKMREQNDLPSLYDRYEDQYEAGDDEEMDDDRFAYEKMAFAAASGIGVAYAYLYDFADLASKKENEILQVMTMQMMFSGVISLWGFLPNGLEQVLDEELVNSFRLR